VIGIVIKGINNPNGVFSLQSSLKWLLNYYEAEWTPFQTHYFSENLVAPGIEP
jgi:hypothetical protein